jgi:putative transposase
VTDRAFARVLFRHKNIRRPAAHYVGQREYFITFCCYGRRAVFAEAGTALWLIEELRRHSARCHFAVYAYCLMPEHFHALVRGLEPASDLLVFLKGFKQETAYEFRKEFRATLWQKKFYDYILRCDDLAERVAAYIWANPVRSGICCDALEYPFSGSFVLDRKKLVSPVGVWEPSWKAKGLARGTASTSTSASTATSTSTSTSKEPACPSSLPREGSQGKKAAATEAPAKATAI